jgi:hypothetical protein
MRANDMPTSPFPEFSDEQARRVSALLEAERWRAGIGRGGIGPGKALTNALREVIGESRDDWRSIESAPRDSSIIRLRWGSDLATFGWWDASESAYPWAFIEPSVSGAPTLNRAVSGPLGPTHWKPVE